MWQPSLLLLVHRDYWCIAISIEGNLLRTLLSRNFSCCVSEECPNPRSHVADISTLCPGRLVSGRSRLLRCDRPDSCSVPVLEPVASSLLNAASRTRIPICNERLYRRPVRSGSSDEDTQIVLAPYCKLHAVVWMDCSHCHRSLLGP